jgi:integrase
LWRRCASRNWKSVSKVVDLTHQVVTQIVAGKNVLVPDAVKAWYEHVTGSKILSPTTIYNNLGFLSRWVGEMNLDKKSLTLIQPRDISDYVNRGSEKRTSAVRKLSAIRSFFAFCQDSGLTYRNPASKSLVKVTYDVFTHDEKENREREPFTPEEVEALLKVAGPFWRAAIRISLDAGLRLGDIAKLEWSSFKEGRLIVWTDKGNTRVDIPVSDAINEALLELSTTDIQFVFPEQRLIALDPTRRSLLSVQFSRLCKKSGVSQKSFHCLRHTHATNYAGDHTLEETAARLGHRSTQVTSTYVHSHISGGA